MGRAPCCDKANVKKGPWSSEEDAKLKEYIGKYGTGGNWIALPQKAGLKRCGKSCRLRWLNYLRPNIRHGEYSDYEDMIICNLYASIGSRWSVIAAQLPGRTDNDIKNYWNTKLKKKVFPISQEKQTFFSSMSFQQPLPYDHHQTSHNFFNTSSPFYTFSTTPNFMNVDNISNSLFVHDDHNHVTNLQSSSSSSSSPSLPPNANNLMSNNSVDVSKNCLDYLGFQDDHYSICNNIPMLMFGSTCSSSEGGKQKYQIKQEDYQITLDDPVFGDQYVTPLHNNLEEVKQSYLFHDDDENKTAHYQKGTCSYYY